jgi:hypothetical protein
MPAPVLLGTQRPRRLPSLLATRADRFGVPRDRGLAPRQAGHFRQQCAAFLEAVGDTARPGGEALPCRREAVGAQADGLVPRAPSCAAAAAQLRGVAAGQTAEQTHELTGAVAVVVGRARAVRAGDAVALVAVFFPPEVRRRLCRRCGGRQRESGTGCCQSAGLGRRRRACGRCGGCRRRRPGGWPASVRGRGLVARQSGEPTGWPPWREGWISSERINVPVCVQKFHQLSRRLPRRIDPRRTSLTSAVRTIRMRS